jgi:hypothetical protein
LPINNDLYMILTGPLSIRHCYLADKATLDGRYHSGGSKGLRVTTLRQRSLSKIHAAGDIGRQNKVEIDLYFSLRSSVLNRNHQAQKRAYYF